MIPAIKASEPLTNEEERFLHRAFQLAQYGHQNVSPNPTVGAVIVYNGEIIGEGYHRVFGRSHAEINALNHVSEEKKKRIAGSTMYVSLEPCSHHGQTPPCADAIIDAGIQKVVIGILDPNPRVNGKGVKKMLEAGIYVKLSDLTEEAIRSNRPFLYSQVLNRPYIILKWAQTYDGYMGHAAERTKVSNRSSDILVHKWRSEIDAILVGSRTALIDDPRLNTRLVKGTSPLRILVDRQLIVPQTHNIYRDDAPTWTFTRETGSSTGLKRMSTLPENEEQQLPFIIKSLHEKSIQRLMVEGGAKMLRLFISQGIWDEARVITSDQKIGQGVKAPWVKGRLTGRDHLAGDRIETILNEDNYETVLERCQAGIR
ncbi:MAG: bifunctional diaminohydroxyphosphoribosylaminopyrimidine deaminase/5-amino-6-(5-phosphoribosylamino)uracil reductase RibD [Saprospiraceae bacterium]|nr:bifunctional diaminohydroxyphosphoribosylaminopyrimidine deaminase/5-amino-6-(5-phosphoribosylamino)uracil reductase RibD [Saprospiraceae bacterium]